MKKVNQYLRQVAKLQSDNPIGVVIASQPEISDLMKAVDIAFEPLVYTEKDRERFVRMLGSCLEDQKPFVFITLKDLPTPLLINHLRQLRDHSITDFVLGEDTLGTIKNQTTTLILWLTESQFSVLPNDLFGAVCNLTYQD